MRQNLNNLMIAPTCICVLALATAAGAAAYDERAISQSTQAYLVTGEAGTKVAFRATGSPSDLVVIRLPDGSVFAAATIEELEKGITGGEHKIPSEPKPLPKPGPAKSAATDGDGTEPDLGDAGAIDDASTAVSSGKVSDPIEMDDDTLAKDAGAVLAPSKTLIDDTRETWFAFASLPWAFHGGSVSIYRGAELLDRDMILLY